MELLNNNEQNKRTIADIVNKFFVYGSAPVFCLTFDPTRKTTPKKTAEMIAIILPSPTPLRFPKSLPWTIIHPEKIIIRDIELRAFIFFPYTNFSINNVNAGATIPNTVVFAIDVNFNAPNQNMKCIAKEAPAKYSSFELLVTIGPLVKRPV